MSVHSNHLIHSMTIGGFVSPEWLALCEDINVTWVVYIALIFYEYHGRVCTKETSSLTEKSSLTEQNHQASNEEKKYLV